MIYIICGILFVVGIIVLFLVVNYNRLVRVKNHCIESWSNIDTELKRRYDLIPNLVKTVKGYASHERELLERVTQLREQAMGSAGGSIKEQAHVEGMLGQALGNLMVRLEAYPDLKANQNFLELQHELTNTEDRIQAAYRLFNGNVRENNNAVEMFPTNIIAGMFGFKKREFFEVDETTKVAMQKTPDIEF